MQDGKSENCHRSVVTERNGYAANALTLLSVFVDSLNATTTDSGFMFFSS